MILTRALPADCDLLAVHRLAPQRYPALLQSTASALYAGRTLGRWDMLLATDGEALCLHRDGRLHRRDASGAWTPVVGDDQDFLRALDADWRALRLPREEPRWPFRGGWALYLGYELAGQVEPVLRLPQAEGALPVAMAFRCPAALLRDTATGEGMALAEAGREDLLDALCAAVASADVASADVASADVAVPPLPAWRPPQALHEDAPEAFVAGVERVLDYLRAGDVFQVNLSRGWRATLDDGPLAAAAALHARLRVRNPAPFAGLLAGEGWALASASPERLVATRGDIVETRPIAGTRPRFPGDDDAERIRELVGHPKERAEHVMLIDLERNDLGRVCVPGSVEVDELMTVESYAHVHHIVSNVRGRLRVDVPPGETIRAVFPGGTITGCPKVRCMQIVAELEGAGRSAYTGALGWLNRDGDLDLNILIRSAELDADPDGPGSRLRFRTGAGIVIDSDPQRELEETRAKARGMLRALEADDGG